MKNWYKKMAKGQKKFVYFVSIVATVLSLSGCALSPQDYAELNQGLQNLSGSLERSNAQMNYNNQQFMNRNNVYKVRPVGPYGY